MGPVRHSQSTVGRLSPQIAFHASPLVALPFTVMWGVTSALVAMTCTHDARYVVADCHVTTM